MESKDIMLLAIILIIVIGLGFVFYIIFGGLSKKNIVKSSATNPNPTPQPLAQSINYDSEKQKHLFPLKLQAYERIVLFMERIEPSSLVIRTKTHAMSSAQLHGALLDNIRQEYEHNVAQQIYISDNAWNLVKQAKEETIRIVNMAADSMDKDSSGNDLTRNIFEKMMVLPKSPSQIALEYVKQEIKELI